MRWLATTLGVPPADRSDPTWHISPVVDSLAYAFSWLWVLIPMVLVSGTDRLDYLGAYLVVLTFTDVHRHYGLPYVYLDRQVFRRHPIRFTLFPLVMVALFVAAPFMSRSRLYLDGAGVAGTLGALLLFVQLLGRDRDDRRPTTRQLATMFGSGVAAAAVGFALASILDAPNPVGVTLAVAAFVASLTLDLLQRGADPRPRFVAPALTGLAVVAALVASLAEEPTLFRLRGVIAFVAVVAGLWNIWHVYMQKYGILRLYQAKARPLREERGAADVPGWVDRLMLFAWMPLYLFALVGEYRGEVFQLFPQGRATLGPLFDVVASIAPVGLPVSIALVVVAVGLFVHHERRAHGFRSRARLVMAIGTLGLASTFLFVHPLKAYLAFAFSHALEYMVFVWAYQRRRYREPLPHRPLIERALRFPWLAYVLSALALGALFLYWKYWGRWIVVDADQPRLFGWRAMEWVGYWTIFQSMVHFYFDGFLWKMRLPAVRATIGART
ncbi:MAG: hypothetical protein JJ863_35120 [Deltaproteobacteria bacterium]|nr:hypothetical protein [Deltaproteobacteria bacterium]